MKIKFSKSINNNLEENEVVLSIQHNNKNKGLTSFIKYIQEYNNYKYLVAKKDYVFYKISHNDIIYFFSENKNNFCKTLDGIYQIKSKLYEIEKLNSDFMRISKNCIVNINHIKNFDSSYTGNIKINLDDGSTQVVSRRKIKDVLFFLDERIL